MSRIHTSTSDPTTAMGKIGIATAHKTLRVESKRDRQHVHFTVAGYFIQLGVDEVHEVAWPKNTE